MTRDHAPRGYRDIDIDDYEPDSFLGQLTGGATGGGNHRVAVSLLLVPT